MADLPQFNRNYGAMVTAKEFWGGNNGFVTIGVQMPTADYELAAGAAYDILAKRVKDAVATDAELIQVSNAQRNLFRVAQAVSQRAVLVAISGCKLVDSTEKLDDISVTVGGDILAAGKTLNVDGTPSAATAVTAAAGKPIYYVTFMIERADALNKQENKPGATYALTIDPCKELIDMFMSVTGQGFFESKTFTQDPDGKLTAGTRDGADAAVVKVFDALPILK